jgi:membrane associated rhomboid family serine protease
MGIYDREYYRRDGPGFLRYFSEHGKICKWLIGINIAVFILQTVVQQFALADPQARDWFTEALQLSTPEILHGEVWRLLTAAFLHGGIWHILMNMVVLWWAGAEMEDLYGPWEFLTFYLVAAVAGNLAQLGYYLAVYGLPPYTLGMAPPAALGASGAVTAAMVLFAFHYPDRRILVMWVIPMKVWVAVVLFLAINTFGLLQVNGGVAVAAHLGGAALGFGYYTGQWRFLNLWSWLRSRRVARRPRLRVYREEEAPASPRAPVSVAAAPRSDVDEHLEAKLDEVLEKVARFGQDSLTESERQILFRASEVYKKRRS